MSAIRLRGATSGTTDVVAAAIAGDGVLSLPSGTGTLATAASVATAKAEAIAGGGLVAVAPTSIANSGGSASTTGFTTTFTGVTSISLNGVFSSLYRNYLFVYSASNASGSDLIMRFRAAGTDSSGSNYTQHGAEISGTTLYGSARSSVTDAYINYMRVSSKVSVGTVNVFAPNVATPTSWTQLGDDGQGLSFRLFTGSNTLTTQHDGLSLFGNAGTLTGTIMVYGYAN